ncbi:MAG TPA: hypothetical protein VGQ06_03430 [Gemmatimonadales bacterium]|jgi:hypothetical protein|nr:hypothetical protein [Gemmatimonadales bacterium]
MSTRRVLFLLLWLAACGSEDRVLEPAVGLPAELHVVGTAAGPRGDGGSISCGFALLVTLAERRRTPAWIEYEGSMGGEAHRATLDSAGGGFEFWADVAWPSVVARLVSQDSIELLIGDTTITDRRFWREMAFIRGARHPEDPGSGTWTCAPFDIYEGGYVDTMGVVQGTWWVEPPSAR